MMASSLCAPDVGVASMTWFDREMLVQPSMGRSTRDGVARWAERSRAGFRWWLATRYAVAAI